MGCPFIDDRTNLIDGNGSQKSRNNGQELVIICFSYFIIFLQIILNSLVVLRKIGWNSEFLSGISLLAEISRLC